MGMLDGLLGQLGGNVDIGNLAGRLGLDPAQVEQAIAALGIAHAAPGDTVQGAADTTGLPTDSLQQIVAAIGGEGSLARFAEMLGAGTGTETQGGEGLGGMLSGLAGSFFDKR